LLSIVEGYINKRKEYFEFPCFARKIAVLIRNGENGIIKIALAARGAFVCVCVCVFVCVVKGSNKNVYNSDLSFHAFPEKYIAW
jgi:hypothetical protein